MMYKYWSLCQSLKNIIYTYLCIFLNIIQKMSEKKKKIFRPFTTCRYLAGEINDYLNLQDLFDYNCHRYKVFYMKPLVDSKPIKMNPHYLIRIPKLIYELNIANTIDKENKQLLDKLNYIHRNGGYLNTFNPNAYRRNTANWKTHEKEMKDLARLNKGIYKLLITAKPAYSKKEFDKHAKEALTLKRNLCRFELVPMKKNYDLILAAEPSISSGLDKTENAVRPLCFMEFKVRNGPYLGKIIIELYDDIVPVTCQNFMELCNAEGELSYKDCLLHRIVRGRFIETGDITHNNGRGGMSIYGKSFQEERHLLKHTRAGVLSMKRIPISDNNSQFIITLNPMEGLDKMNVVFGKVIKGNNVLFVIQDYGRVIGKPLAEVVISNCGVIEAES